MCKYSTDGAHNFVALVHIVYEGEIPRVAACSKCGAMR